MIDFGIGIFEDIFQRDKYGMLLRRQNYFCWCPLAFAISSKVILQGGIIAILLRLDLQVAN